MFLTHSSYIVNYENSIVYGNCVRNHRERWSWFLYDGYCRQVSAYRKSNYSLGHGSLWEEFIVSEKKTFLEMMRSLFDLLAKLLRPLSIMPELNEIQVHFIVRETNFIVYTDRFLHRKEFFGAVHYFFNGEAFLKTLRLDKKWEGYIGTIVDYEPAGA